jgi:hypothetical protein
MTTRLLAAFFVAIMACGPACAVTGNVIVYDDADENSFNRFAASCEGGSSVFDQTTVVHSGTHALAVSRQSANGVGWAGPTNYSTSSDFDGVVFWINPGNDPTTSTSLAVFDSASNNHFLKLEDIYGGPLPAATWIRFEIPFSSSFFTSAGSTPPDDFSQVCVINHSSGSMTNFLYIDDVSLTGADIFKDSFEPVSK